MYSTLNLKPQWEEINKRMAAYQSSFREAKVDLSENCLFDLIPMRYLTEYCYLKTEIIKHVFKTQEKPENYDFMKELSVLLTEMEGQKSTTPTKTYSESGSRSLARNLLAMISSVLCVLHSVS